MLQQAKYLTLPKFNHKLGKQNKTATREKAKII